MFSRDLHAKFIAAGIVLLPVVLVKLMSLWVGVAGDAPSTAQPQPANLSPVVDVKQTSVTIHRGDDEAKAYAAQLESQEFGQSPLHHDGAAETAQEQDEQPIETTADVEIVIRGILSSRGQSIAIINGQPHRVGDDVASMWTVVEIDIEARSVTLEAASGDREVHTVITP